MMTNYNLNPILRSLDIKLLSFSFDYVILKCNIILILRLLCTILIGQVSVHVDENH